MSRSRAVLRRFGKPTPKPRHVVARRLLTLGLFDRQFFEAQCGHRFEDDLSAVRSLLGRGPSRGWTFHPLVEPDYADTTWATNWRGGWNLNKFGDAIDGIIDPATCGSTSPVFDSAVWMDRHPDAEDHPAGPLGHFIATARDDTLLPVTQDYVGPAMTWGDFRVESLRRTRAYRDQMSIAGTRTSTDWDPAQHADWLQRWSDAPVPTFEGRPAVSVIMPVRNRPDVVVDAVRSVQAQTHADWELVVIDDGSTDDTPLTLRALAEDDPRVRVLTLASSQGASAARNAGLDAVRGEYVAFLDSDDTWETAFLHLMLAAMHGQDLRAAHAVAEVDSGERRVFLAHEGGFEDLMVRNHVNMNVLVVETALLREVGGFDPAFRRWIDHDVALRLARRTRLALLPFIGSRHDDSQDAPDRITLTESNNWEFAALGKNLIDWADVESRVADRVPGRVSVLIPTYQDHAMTAVAVHAVLDNSRYDDIEVVVIDNGSKRSVSAVLWSMFAGEPRVQVHRLVRNYNFSGGTNEAFARSTGEYVVFLNNDTAVRPGWLAPLLAELADPDVLGAQPLLLFGDDTVQSAGSVFLADGHVATAFLVGHPPEDAQRDPGTGFRAVTTAALAMRADDVAALHGFDCLYANGMEDVDLCLRAQERRPTGRFRVVHDCVVTHFEGKSTGRGLRVAENRRIFVDRWQHLLTHGAEGRERYAALGFTIDALLSDGVDNPAPRPVLRRPLSAFHAAGTQDLPESLRWSINIAALAGPKGDMWGDVHFAYALRDSLERLGQQVAVLRHGAHDFPLAHLADVTLTLRGLDRVAPQPSAINMLWVISHPDLVDHHEVGGYDVVAACSPLWARHMGARAGRTIHVVQQATDPARFAPVPDASEDVPVLFVGGRPRTRERPIVEAAVKAGVDLGVWGAGWADDLPPGVLRGEHLPNDQLGIAYARAGIVLNDHWPDMVAQGFVNNRLFDALATGARVVSDHVDGIQELFGAGVRTYTDAADLAELCGPRRDEFFLSREARLKLADHVRTEHSFDRRAEQLLDLAREAWAARLSRTSRPN